MIQRIQTIYLLLVTALLITSMCLPVGSFIGADAAMYVFKPLGVEMNGTLYSTWGVFGILLLSAIIAFATIFLFKNRMLQIRMTIFNSILLIGYYLTFLAFMFVLKKECYFPDIMGIMPAVNFDYSELAGGPCDRTR